MYEVKVSGMTCGSCASSITHALKTIDPKVKVSVDLQTQTVRVESLNVDIRKSEIGYPSG